MIKRIFLCTNKNSNVLIPGYLALLLITGVCYLPGVLWVHSFAGPTDSEYRYPSQPYRGWYQPPWIMQEPELYPGVSLHVSGTKKKKMDRVPELNRRGIAVLRWSWGPQSPHSNNDPDYFYDWVNPEKRGGKENRFVGFGIDEWKPNLPEDSRRAAAEGYRRARRTFPEVFIAAWVTEPNKLFIELMQDGTLKKRVLETHAKFPEMPGVVFMGTNTFDNKETREVIKFANELAGDTYPDPPENPFIRTVRASRSGQYPDKDEALRNANVTVLSAQHPHRVYRMTFQPESLPEPGDLISATLTLEATQVDNDDRQVLKVYPIDRRSTPQHDTEGIKNTLRRADNNVIHPVDARIFYNAGHMRFNVTKAVRDIARKDKNLIEFIICPEPTGYRPPDNPDWKFELNPSRTSEANTLPRLRIESAKQTDGPPPETGPSSR